ncbi:hypothetical protein [Terribacillus saccharophilus]|uniref:hypothetical protein n=1 Tax=Terribacillus saccharophilus TaxID=361277 RepID=UPI000BA78862|nr:hypothetical protein [Terribacillus saccharophilus]PAF15920.1 hypothetical protein CHH51_18095 [Terribacillus saccharophilus]
MDSKEVRKGIEEAKDRDFTNTSIVLQVIFVSFIAMIPVGHWISGLLTLITLTIILIPKKIRKLALFVLTIASAISLAGVFFVYTGIIGALTSFLISGFFLAGINMGSYRHAKEDWEDKDREKMGMRR